MDWRSSHALKYKKKQQVQEQSDNKPSVLNT